MPDTYDLYLRALAEFHRFTDEGFAATLALLERALATDTSNAPAAALVGWVRIFQGVQGWGAFSETDISAAVGPARQALEAERDDAETLARAAFTLFYFAAETAIRPIDLRIPARGIGRVETCNILFGRVNLLTPHAASRDLSSLKILAFGRRSCRQPSREGVAGHGAGRCQYEGD